MGPLMAERTEYIVGALKAANGGLVSSNELRESLNMNRSNFYTAMMSIKRLYPNRIKSVNSRKDGHGYYWVVEGKKSSKKDEEQAKKGGDESDIWKKAEPVKVQEEVVDRFDDKHTEEGIIDMTAYLAMKNVEDSDKGSSSRVLKPGEIWEYKTAKDTFEDYLVIGSYGDHATILQVYWNNSYIAPGKLSEFKELDGGNSHFYYNPSMIHTKPMKYAVENGRLCTISEEAYKGVMRNVFEYFGCVIEPKVVTATKEVEVPVVKEVKVPVEVPSEVKIEGFSAEEVEKKIAEALVCQRAEIYQDIAEKLLKRM